MIAFDTNLLVRLVTNDEPAQARRALARMESDTVWITKTVLLETAWVLRHAYRLDAEAIGHAFEILLGVRNVEIEDRANVSRALSWYEQGLDLADALHVASSALATAFVTLDRALAKRAAKVGANPRVTWP
jgi:predicted nucleic-acid-binding protein